MDFLTYVRMAVLLMVSAPLFANQVAQPENNSIASLHASPGVCELPDDAVSCEMTVNFIWELPTVRKVCLWDSHQELPLKCWNDALTSTWKITFIGAKDREFWLKEVHSETVFARTSIRVMGAIEQRLRARRRQGFWRIF